MEKKRIVSSISFGKRTAEEESAELEKYFVETDEWSRMFSGEIDIVYGPKGSGKSALYALLMRRKNILQQNSIYVLPAENVTGALVFQDIVSSPPTGEEEMQRIWKLYFLSLIGNQIRIIRPTSEKSELFLGTLENAGLLPIDWTLKKGLRAARTYLANLMRFKSVESVETGGTLSPDTGLPDVRFKVAFHEPSEVERGKGIVSIDDLFEDADIILCDSDRYFWVVLDRLDVAFAASPELESNALRGLFKVYLDSLGLKNMVVAQLGEQVKLY